MVSLILIAVHLKVKVLVQVVFNKIVEECAELQMANLHYQLSALLMFHLITMIETIAMMAGIPQILIAAAAMELVEKTCC